MKAQCAITPQLQTPSVMQGPLGKDVPSQGRTHKCKVHRSRLCKLVPPERLEAHAGCACSTFPTMQGGNLQWPWGNWNMMWQLQEQHLSTNPSEIGPHQDQYMSARCKEPCILDEVQSLLSSRCHAQHRAQEQVCCSALRMLPLLPTPETIKEQKPSSSHTPHQITVPWLVAAPRTAPFAELCATHACDKAPAWSVPWGTPP